MIKSGATGKMIRRFLAIARNTGVRYRVSGVDILQRAFLVFLICAVFIPNPAFALFGRSDLRRSIVKIYVTVQHNDYSAPWRSSHPGSGHGSGFIIKGKRILTNAHVVSDARFIELKKYGDPRRYRGRVVFWGHDCDLAVVQAEDPEFYDNTNPVKFAESLPKLSDTVTVIGYPMGGARISLTEGIVSRIDYNAYSHSGVDQHLVLQVDAAINPGNSGGPVFFKRKVVGLAFQGIRSSSNIGYAIPVPVIKHFLDDITDNKYHGYPELGIAAIDTRNDALASDLNIPETETGIAVYYIDPFGAAHGVLKARDVLLTIDGHDIAEDGSIKLNGNAVEYTELIERRQWGESLDFRVWRNNRIEIIPVPLNNHDDPYIFRNIYNERPRFFVSAGLVMTPLTRNYLLTLSRNTTANAQQLIYYSQYAKVDNLYRNSDEFVVLTTRLPHPVNTYADSFINGIIKEVNGITIHRLEDVKRATENPIDGFQVFKFAGMDDSLVIDAKAASEANANILFSYGLPSTEHMGELPE